VKNRKLLLYLKDGNIVKCDFVYLHGSDSRPLCGVCSFHIVISI
jgi:hypothetical protein